MKVRSKKAADTLERAPDPRIRSLLCLAALALVLGILFHESLFRGKGLLPADGIFTFLPWANERGHKPANYVLMDQSVCFIPQRQFFHDRILRGDFPLWNPHLGCGMPSIASMQSAALYPIHLLLSPIHPFFASGIAAFAKLLLAGLFTILYMRRIGASHPAALLSALVYVLSGFMIVWLGHPHVNCAVLLPLLLSMVECQLQEPRTLRYGIGFALAFGAMLLGGHPPTALHITLGILIYFSFRIAQQPRRAPLGSAVLLAGSMAAGALIAAPQLFPYLEYYRESSSALSSAALQRWSSHLTPNTLIHFLLPHLSGSPTAGFENLPTLLGLGDMDNFNERTAYAGVLTLFLASVAVLRRRCRLSLLYTGLILVCLSIIYGVPPLPSVMRALPMLDSSNNQRLLVLVDWSLAILAGLGLDALRPKGAARARGVAIGFGICVLLVLVGLWSVSGPGLVRLDAASRWFVIRQLPVLAGGLLISVIVALRRVPSAWIGVLCVGWTALDLLWFATGYNPAIPAEQYYPTTESIRFLQNDPSTFRVLGLSTTLVPNTAAVFGLYDARGQDFTTLKRYEELITGRAGDFFFYRYADAVPSSFDLLNVKYVLVPKRLPAVPDGYELVYDGEMAIYRYNRHRMRAQVVFDHRVERDPSAILAEVRSGAFDPGRVLLLEEQPRMPEGAPDPTVGAAQARILDYEPDEVTIEALSPRPGFLLLLDNYFPGWKAYSADREIPVYRADYNFRAVPLPSGKSTVRFVYRPASFRLGGIASITVLAVLAIVWLGESREWRVPFSRG